MTFNYSVSLNSPIGFEQDAELINVVRAAASEWSRYISGFGSLDIQIDVSPTTRANTSVATVVNLGVDNSRILVDLGTVNELKTGIDPNGDIPDLTINVDPGYLQTLWLDSNKLTPIPLDKVDGLSVFMHEIGHSLGFIGYRSPIDGRLAGYETPWDRLITLNIDGSATFNGSSSTAVYGKLVPVTTLQNGEQYNHLGNNVAESAGHDLMNGIAFYYGQRYSISDLDIAILKDIGLSINATTGNNSYLPNGGEVSSSTLILRVSEDAYQGDAHFIVAINGKQVGGTLSTSALHAAGQTQDITLTGNFGSGAHDVAVKFIDNADNGWGNDRNLYVHQVTLDGQIYAGDTASNTAGINSFGVANLYSNGSATFHTGGNDTLVFKVSGDNWQGDPHFTVMVDGKQVGGTLTTSALHAAGQTQDITLTGNFGSGTHVVAVKFIDNADNGWGNDRNLYVHQVTLDGQIYAGDTASNTAGFNSLGVANLYSNGSATFHTGGNDTLIFKVSGDNWQGDPHFTVVVDGKQVGGTLTTSAVHAAGQTQDITLTGNFGSGPHDVAVKFLDDAYGGWGYDRNLYVHQVTLDGEVHAGSMASNSSGVASLMSTGSSATIHILGTGDWHV